MKLLPLAARSSALRVRIAATLALAAWATACGLTADFSGLQGGVRDGAVEDAGAAEAPPEGEASDDGSSGFCASLSPKPRLCADFDEGLPVGAGWTTVDVSQGQTVSVDPSVSYSPTASLLSAVSPMGTGYESGRLEESLPVLASHVHAEFKVLLPGGGGPFELFSLQQITPDGSYYGLYYKEEGGKLVAYVSALGSDGMMHGKVYPLGAPPVTWLHVEIDMDISDTGTLVVKHDGAAVVNAVNLPTSTPTRAQLASEIGFFSPNPATAQVHFDDVVIDWP
jgi:hypothetical protein